MPGPQLLQERETIKVNLEKLNGLFNFYKKDKMADRDHVQCLRYCIS